MVAGRKVVNFNQDFLVLGVISLVEGLTPLPPAIILTGLQ